MTKEQQHISYINYLSAAEYYNLQPGECLHHIDTSWLHNDIERYIQWNPEDLLLLTKSQHSKLHGLLQGKTEQERKALLEEAARKYSTNPTINRRYLTVAELLGLRE